MKKESNQKKEPIRNVFVARQPIFDRGENLYAYEILFRSGFTNFYDNLDGDYASSKTIIDSFVTLGIDAITGGKMAFINFTANLIINEIATMFPKNLLGIELLETIEPEENLIKACKKHKKSGYLIILDDFVYHPRFQPLIELADIIKIDFKISDEKERKSLSQKLKNSTAKLLAEKVETKEEFTQAKEMGFQYFQGYFFSKPTIISGHDIPAYKFNYLQILREINQPETEFEKLEHIVKRDVSITYKLLRFINSASFGFPTKIQSIKQALTLLGMKEFKKWVSLIALSGMGYDKPEELIIVSMSRAKFCELLALKLELKQRSSDLFLMGMFSSIDAFIDLPMNEILSELPLADDVKSALLGTNNQFTLILNLVISYERGNWDVCIKHINQLNLKETEIPDYFVTAVQWAHKIF